jgi:hypothetical protein
LCRALQPQIRIGFADPQIFFVAEPLLMIENQGGGRFEFGESDLHADFSLREFPQGRNAHDMMETSPHD